MKIAVILLLSMLPLVAESPSSNRKKGACLTAKQEDCSQKVAALHAAWHYSWGVEPPDGLPDSVEFVPMVWGKPKDPGRLKTKLTSVGKATWLLGFNEPDGQKQANMTVDEAIAAWPVLEVTGLRLGSPAATHGDNEWMREFMQRASADDLRIDFVCVHWYGRPNVGELVKQLKKIHALYGKPIWLTEFAVADWKAKSRAANRYSPETVQRFMKEVLPALDNLEFIERYAWFSGKPDQRALGPSALFEEDGCLTDLGKIYAAHGRDSLPSRQTD